MSKIQNASNKKASNKSAGNKKASKRESKKTKEQYKNGGHPEMLRGKWSEGSEGSEGKTQT